MPRKPGGPSEAPHAKLALVRTDGKPVPKRVHKREDKESQPAPVVRLDGADVHPPTREQLDRLAGLLSTLRPGESLSRAMDLPLEVVAAWERLGREELSRVAGDKARRVRKGYEGFAAFARMAASLTAIGTTNDVLRTRNGKGLGPFTLTQEVEDIVADALMGGMSLNAASGLVGVADTTLYTWRSQGEAILASLDAEDSEVVWDDLDPRAQAKARFAIRCARAISEAERRASISIVTNIEGLRGGDGTLVVDEFGRPVMPPDWKAAAWYLERGPNRKAWRRQAEAGDEGAAAVMAAKEAAKGRPMSVLIIGKDPRVLDRPDDESVVDTTAAELAPVSPYLEDRGLAPVDDDTVEEIG